MTAKLHLNISGKPACGRQLSNHRQERAQLADSMVLAGSYENFTFALAVGAACRHCAREAGLLPRVTMQSRNTEEESSADREVDRLLAEQELDEEEEDEECAKM